MARLRLDARLFDPPPARTPRAIGRPCVVGACQPALEQRLGRADTPRRRPEVIGWYGCGGRTVEAASGTAVWHHTGLPAVLVRWGLVRDPAGGISPQALLCTDLGTEPAELLAWFVRRWSVEVTFAGGAAGRIHRRHLGLETQRQLPDKAVARTTPALLGMLSPVALWARVLHAQGRLPHLPVSWLRKEEPTFGDALAAVRRSIGADMARFPTSRHAGDRVELPRVLLDRLTDLACHALRGPKSRSGLVR